MRFLVGIFCLFLMTCVYAIDQGEDDGEGKGPEREYCIDSPDSDED